MDLWQPPSRSFARPWEMTTIPRLLPCLALAIGWGFQSIAKPLQRPQVPSLGSKPATPFQDENSGGFLAPWKSRDRVKSGWAKIPKLTNSGYSNSQRMERA